MTVGYLGGATSHTFAAASQLCPGETLEGFETVRTALSAVADGKAQAAVVPIENSVEGSVRETLDCLYDFGLYIRRELVLPIRQSLIGMPGAALDKIKTVYSHPQALGQAKLYLSENLPQAKLVAASSTTEAMEFVTSADKAAVARQAKPGLIELKNGIEDYKNNATSFVLVCPSPSFEGEKVSVVFDAENKPGALLKVLSVLNGFKLNMTKIESRPVKTGMGRYIFYVDFLFGGTPRELSGVLDAVSKSTTVVKFLGKYQTVSEA